MTCRQLLAVVVCCPAVLAMPAVSAAQDPEEPAAEMPTTEPATRPAEGEAPTLVYEVISVRGKVRVGATELDPKASEGWSRLKVGDAIGPGRQVHVPWRGRLELAAKPAEPPTVLLIESSSLVNFSELSLRGGEAKNRIVLGYGAIRAGVAEGRTRSDMQIKSPVATLSKRGTYTIRFEYHNRRFRMSLSEDGRGMIQAIQTQATAFGAMPRRGRRVVTPGQWVTHLMAQAIENARFDHQINVTDEFGLTESDQRFVMSNDHGVSFLLPGGGNVVNFLGTPTSGLGGITDGGEPIRPELVTEFRTNFGDFGIGQGNLPSIFDFAAKIRHRRARR